MTKGNGLGDNLYIDGYDLSGDIQVIDRINGGPATIDQTGIDKYAHERAGGRRDGNIDVTTYFNDAAGQAFPVLSARPTTDRIVSYFRGTAIGNQSACLVAKQLDYDPQYKEDGSLLIKVKSAANQYGLEWGNQLTAGKRTDTGAAVGTGWDGAAATSLGLQAYLHVFSFAGTDVTIKLQESSDNGSGDAWADVVGGAFTQVTAGPTKERIATAADLAVERYLRVTTVTTGGFTSCVFAVTVVKNTVAVSF